MQIARRPVGTPLSAPSGARHRPEAPSSKAVPTPATSNGTSRMRLLNWQRSIDQIVLTPSAQTNRVLGLTSSRRGSGVSLICRAVAKTLAAAGNRTLLIDLSEAPASRASPDAAASGAPPPDNVVRFDADGYDVCTPLAVAAGAPPLSLPRVRIMLAADFSAYHRIVIDMPPVFDDAESALSPIAMAALCDRLMLVCLIGRDTRTEVLEVASLLHSAGAELAGVVANEYQRVDPRTEIARALWLTRRK
jgi:Mrp family chromosome partitioning ATPase